MSSQSDSPEIKLFITSGCPHCQKLKDIVMKGRFNRESVDLIDLNTPEGSPYLDSLPIKSVPAAFKGNIACKLILTADRDGDLLLIDCGDKEG